ncbi:MAG: hypothetical protein ACLTDR_09210 [Adlercreutzia equolifaciens]
MRFRLHELHRQSRVPCLDHGCRDGHTTSNWQAYCRATATSKAHRPDRVAELPRLRPAVTVVAYALARTWTGPRRDALGRDAHGTSGTWPSHRPGDEVVACWWTEHVTADLAEQGTRDLYDGMRPWQARVGSRAIRSAAGTTASTYVRRAPYFDGMGREVSRADADRGRSRAGRFWATSSRPDHISPAGSIAADSPRPRVPGGTRRGSGRLQHLRARRGNHR